MGIYILIFLAIGLLGETIWRASSFAQNMGLLEAMQIVLSQILSGKIFPMFTLIMVGVSLLMILVTIKFGNKLMLAGNEYTKITAKENLTPQENQLLNIIEELKISSRLRFMPEVYIMETDTMNAFASGWKEENSLVAITRGLLEKLSRHEIEAVMAHEMAHIKNADVRLTLVVGILTNIMLMAVDMLFYTVLGRRGSDNKVMQQARIVIFILRFLLPLLTVVLQMYISRKREFMADAGSVEFTGDKDSMISALMKISGDYESNTKAYEQDLEENGARKYAYFFGAEKLFSTHPSIEERIKNLG